jgi:uncharacterized protein YndB with AHSA1/START domain
MHANTRCHVHEERFAVPQRRLFEILHTPSAIRDWWSAARVIVLAEPGGTFAATWGGSEDDPDYVTVARIRDFEPPVRMVLTDYRYRAKSGPLPFEANFVTEFTVRSESPAASILRVAQDGFPAGREGEAFFAACDRGWRDTFAGIRRYLEA